NEVLSLTSTDRTTYLQAIGALKALNIPLSVAVKEYVNAVTRLPTGVTLRDAVETFVRRNPARLPVKTVKEVVDELVVAKSQAGRSKLHINDLASRLGRFAEGFQMHLNEVTGPLIQKYLDGLNLSGRTRRNHLQHITT